MAVAEECRIIADYMGCYTFKLPDVSVDGLHRVLHNLPGETAHHVLKLADTTVIQAPCTGFCATFSAVAMHQSLVHTLIYSVLLSRQVCLFLKCCHYIKFHFQGSPGSHCRRLAPIACLLRKGVIVSSFLRSNEHCAHQARAAKTPFVLASFSCSQLFS